MSNPRTFSVVPRFSQSNSICMFNVTTFNGLVNPYNGVEALPKIQPELPDPRKSVVTFPGFAMNWKKRGRREYPPVKNDTEAIQAELREALMLPNMQRMIIFS